MRCAGKNVRTLTEGGFSFCHRGAWLYQERGKSGSLKKVGKVWKNQANFSIFSWYHWYLALNTNSYTVMSPNFHRIKTT